MDRKTADRIKALTKEKISIVPYDPSWPSYYTAVEEKLKKTIPGYLVLRIAHIGSTAVPGLSAKPIIDVQVEVNDLELVKNEVVPLMEAEGYEYLWRPSIGESAPYYAWFIKRNAEGQRTYHVHVVEPDQASVDRIIFRNYLRDHSEEARVYEALKFELVKKHSKDRAAYTQNKTDYVNEVLAKARTQKIKK